MALAGHATRLKVSGAAVAVTGEATTHTTGNVYQVTNTAKRIVDPSAALVVYDGVTPLVLGTNFTFDWLFGIATLVAPPGGTVTMDLSYLPVATIAEGKGFSFKGDAGLLESTSYDSAGVRSKIAGLKDSSGNANVLSIPLEDIDPVTGGVQTLHDVFAAGTPKLIEITLGSSYLRWWVMIESFEVKGDVGGLVETTLNLSGAPRTLGASFGIGS